MQAEESSRDRGAEKPSMNEAAPGERLNKGGNGGSRTSVWEWMTALVGLVLVAGAIGFMLYKTFRGSESLPDVKVRVESIDESGSAYLVRFSAVNQGGMTAAQVAFEAELKRDGEKVETSQATLDFLPADSTRKGGFFFKNDPRRFDLQIRAVGYQQP